MFRQMFATDIFYDIELSLSRWPNDCFALTVALTEEPVILLNQRRFWLRKFPVSGSISHSRYHQIIILCVCNLYPGPNHHYLKPCTVVTLNKPSYSNGPPLRAMAAFLTIAGRRGILDLSSSESSSPSSSLCLRVAPLLLMLSLHWVKTSRICAR